MWFHLSSFPKINVFSTEKAWRMLSRYRKPHAAFDITFIKILMLHNILSKTSWGCRRQSFAIDVQGSWNYYFSHFFKSTHLTVALWRTLLPPTMIEITAIPSSSHRIKFFVNKTQSIGFVSSVTFFNLCLVQLEIVIIRLKIIKNIIKGSTINPIFHLFIFSKHRRNQKMHSDSGWKQKAISVRNDSTKRTLPETSFDYTSKIELSSAYDDQAHRRHRGIWYHISVAVCNPIYEM